MMRLTFRVMLIVFVAQVFGCSNPASDWPAAPAADTIRCWIDSSDSYVRVRYFVDESPYRAALEEERFIDAIGKLRRNQDIESKVRNRGKLFVAVAIQNLPEHRGEEGFAESHKAGRVFAVSDIWSSAKAAAEVARTGFRDEMPVVKDGRVERWNIIDKHRTLQNEHVSSEGAE